METGPKQMLYDRAEGQNMFGSPEPIQQPIQQPYQPPRQDPQEPQYGPRVPQQSTFNAPGMGQQTMTPQLDQMSGQPGYPTTPPPVQPKQMQQRQRPAWLEGNGISPSEITRNQGRVDAVLSQYGLTDFMNPATSGPAFDTFRTDSFAPDESNIARLENISNAIGMALNSVKGTPLESVMRQKLATAFLPEIEQYTKKPGWSGMHNKAWDWMSGGRQKQANVPAMKIKQQLMGSL
jgi:hypothetical protein